MNSSGTNATDSDGPTNATDPDVWREYWASVADSGRRRQVDLAAADPLGKWLVAEAPVLVDEYDIDPGELHADPDAAFAAAREGFEALVAARDLPGHDDDRYGYESLPVHLTAVGRVDSGEFALRDPVADANALVTLDGTNVVGEPTRRHEAAVLTYRCPRGHETTVRQPLLRTWTVETCGEADCRQDAVPDDARTRPRWVARFSIDGPGGALPCVATGRYAADEFDRLAGATRVHLTGVVRLLVDANGELEPTCEVVAAEPTV
jgi:hypothetical protein